MKIQDILDFLEINKDKKVSTIRVELQEMLDQLSVSNRPLGRTYLVGPDNKVFAIYCYYHKQWELLSEVEYGQKVSSSTGYNTMCKIGVREWTRQQKLIKMIPGEILKLVETGKLDFSEVSSYKAKREAELRVINEETRPVGYQNQEDIPTQE